MWSNGESKKNKLIGTLIILFGIMAIFAYIILYKSELTFKKTNFTEAINKQVTMVDKKIQNYKVAVKERIIESQNKLEKAKGKFIDTTKDSEKSSELEKIRAEVERSKDATVEEEKLETEKIKSQTKQANKSSSIDESIKEAEKQARANRDALVKANHELGEAYLQVESPKEQQLIAELRSSVSKLQADPSYDSSSDQASLKANYSKLEEDSKNRIRVALITNVHEDSIKHLKKAFGL